MEYAKSKDGIPICHGDKWEIGANKHIRTVVGLSIGNDIMAQKSSACASTAWIFDELIRPITFHGVELDWEKFIYRYGRLTCDGWDTFSVETGWITGFINDPETLARCHRNNYCEECSTPKVSCTCKPAALPQPANLPDGAIAYPIERNVDGRYITMPDRSAWELQTEEIDGIYRLGYCYGDNWAIGRALGWRKIISGTFADWAVFMPDKDDTA